MIVGQGWHELGKYLTNVDFTSPLAACGAINLDYWNSLPPEIQKEAYARIENGIKKIRKK